MYPSMLARGSGTSSSVGEEVGIGMGVSVEPYYSVPVGTAGCPGQHWSQPTSPTPAHASRQPPNLYQHVHKDDESKSTFFLYLQIYLKNSKYPFFFLIFELHNRNFNHTQRKKRKKKII